MKGQLHRRCTPRDLWWDELVAGEPGSLPPLELESEARYLLAHTSGTTGRPKGAVHVHGGFLLAIAREVAYYTDVRAGDRVLFVTDLGWIMGPWMIKVFVSYTRELFTSIPGLVN